MLDILHNHADVTLMHDQDYTMGIVAEASHEAAKLHRTLCLADRLGPWLTGTVLLSEHTKRRETPVVDRRLTNTINVLLRQSHIQQIRL